jgi:periplasmic divalent cation tolerance protein
MTKFIQVITTTNSRENALAIAESLLNQRQAACVQVLGPLVSRYWWEKRQEESQEWQCIIKTSRTLYLAVETQIKTLHPYRTPEIIMMPIEGGNEAYLAWLGEELSCPREG